MNCPKELKYRKSHEWIKFIDDTTALIGISDHAQDALGGIVYANFPEEGDEIAAGETFADVESVKAVSDIYSPVTGVVAAANEELLDSPELINDDPYGAWFVKVENITGVEDDLLDADEYEAFVASEEE